MAEGMGDGRPIGTEWLQEYREVLKVEFGVYG